MILPNYCVCVGLNYPLLWQHRMQGDGGRAQLFSECRSNLFATLPFSHNVYSGQKREKKTSTQPHT